MIREEQIANIIGKDKAFEPPFRVEEHPESGDAWIIDRNGACLIMSTDILIMGMEHQNAIARHICDLLNKEHAEVPCKDSPRDEQIREVNPYKNYDTDPWMDDVRDWCRYQGFNEGARWADAHPVDASGHALSETIGTCDGYRDIIGPDAVFKPPFECHAPVGSPGKTYVWDRDGTCMLEIRGARHIQEALNYEVDAAGVQELQKKIGTRVADLLNAKSEIFKDIYQALDYLDYSYYGSPEEQHAIRAAISSIKRIEKKYI